jgi:hypothetical protein
MRGPEAGDLRKYHDIFGNPVVIEFQDNFSSL